MVYSSRTLKAQDEGEPMFQFESHLNSFGGVCPEILFEVSDNFTSQSLAFLGIAGEKSTVEEV